MRIPQLPVTRPGLKTTLAVGVLALLTAAFTPRPACSAPAKGVRIPLTIRAGTVYNLTQPPSGSNYLYDHEVRGIAQVSHLGNCKVHFDVDVAAGGNSGHALLAEGTLIVTTLTGDQLIARVDGYADADADGGGMFDLHYEVTITGGTGKLAGASGQGAIDGAFVLLGAPGTDDDPTDDKFCDAYDGVATWRFDGLMILPRHRK